MRYQTKLLIAFGGLLALALSAASLSYWGADRSRYHLERSRLAHEELEGYLRLSAHTYELFKELGDGRLVGDPEAGTGHAGLARRLEADLARLRDLIASEVAFVDAAETEVEKRELAHLALIERRIAEVLREVAEVGSLRVTDRAGEGRARLSGLLERSLDAELDALIAAAIEEEAREVARTDAAAARLLDRLELALQVHGAAAILFTLGCVALLVRGLRRPLTRLLAGTEALAAGDLGHRIEVSGRDEFARLGHSFNRMAEDLGSHRSQLENAQSRLEQAVAARTEELREANTALAHADRARRRFFADISHELRTPLTIVKGEGEITLRGADKPVEEYKRALGRVVEQADHTARLVDDLLFIARQDAGETRMSLQAVALGDLVARVCEDARVLAAERRVAIVRRVAVADAVVSGDPGRLRQLFLILIDNAVRYSRPHGTVSVDLGRSPKGVAVRVADDGIGIPPDELERVFERFYRGDRAAGHHLEGSGLGLPVAKAIVEAHHGEIAVASGPEAGTVVTVTLPAARRLGAVA